jgi:phage terminase large subunit
MQAERTFKIPHKFVPRHYQLPLLKPLDNGIKKNIWCLHRGAGKDLLALNYLIGCALKKRGVYLHCFPNYSQGKKAIWKSNHSTDDGDVVAYLEHIPEQLIKSKNSSEMVIEFVNGSIYCVMGLDGKNANRARGMNPNFVILSEYAFMDPESWYTVEPRVTQNNGTVIFASTPNGQNHFYHLYNHAKSNPKEYFSSLLTIDDTSVFPSNFIQSKRDEGIPEDFIQQEYYCSFTRGSEGSYYGKLIQNARDEDRVTSLSISSDLPCFTAWDIGIGDSTAIWIFQILHNGKYNFLNYYENNNEGLEHYIRYLDNWKVKNSVVYDTHYMPHDMQQREYTSGVDRLTTARNMGLKVMVTPKKSIEEGIQAVRSLLPHCVFDSKSCERGIKCLDFYRKKWNETLKVYYDEPLHDQWSHGADAFRMAAIGVKAYGTGASKLSPDSINDMRKRNLGY